MAILLSGMRKGEAEFLTWEDVSLELGVIFIREKPDIGWQPKTDERLIPISPVLHGILVGQFAHRTSERWVFGNRSGNRETHMLEKLKTVCVRAGIKAATVHALRHSLGAHQRMAGINLADIADLGHKDLVTTQIHAKVLQDHLRQVVSKLSPLVSDANPSETDEMSLENVIRAEIGNADSPKLLK
jgi:integrase